MLYLEGPLGSGKTGRLLEETARLLEHGPASAMLVLCSNHARQQAFIEQLLKRLNAPVAQLPVYTYPGFVRNMLFNYWPLVEEEIASALKKGSPRIRPELAGQEDTELLLKWLLAKLRARAQSQNQEVFKDFPGTDQHILKQIIRRLQLRSQNQLSRKDMQERSALLEEMCQPEVSWLEQQFDVESYTLRVLDPNKQLDIFSKWLTSENPASRWLKGSIKHLIVDDVDETIVAQQRLIEFLAPSLETLIMAADIDGGSRRGYLNAYPYDWQALKSLRPGETVVLFRTDAMHQAGQTLLSNWKKLDQFDPLPASVQIHDRFITRVEMLEAVVDDVLDLLENGHHPGDLAIVLPKTDFLSFYQLQSRLNGRGIPTQLLSGTKRPSDNPKCRGFIYLLQWANSENWKTCLSRWELKTVLMQVFQFHHLPGLEKEKLDLLVSALHEQLSHDKTFACHLPFAGSLPVALEDEALARYERLREWLVKAKVMPFLNQLYTAFDDLLAVYSSERDGYGDLKRIIESYLRQREMHDRFQPDEDDFDRWWLQQVKTGVVADTPEMPEAVNPESVVIGTPQKMIDNEIHRQIQLWLDVGSREWARSDNAPLYNAWVHSAVWDGSAVAFTEEFNEAVIRTRAGHITRSLMLLAGESVRAYASELDDLGFTQIGLLKPRLLAEEAPTNGTIQRAKLRDDQAPVLQYKGGTMAISAVPGAGKTFVNVELLLELIERGVEPDRILVLTYMDSAAKTLLARLKAKLAGVTRKLPIVSTIHSLAFRILTENDHALLAGFLPEDMTILDDYARGDILNKVAAVTQPESARNTNDWTRAIDRGINHCKMFNLSAEDIREHLRQIPDNFRLREFLPALELYEKELHHAGALDFTDLITKAVSILEHYPDIRQKYQQQFEFIIEDEAQDSSRLLQEFIRLLGGDKPNLIRTGDTNQSITTTFSSAEPAVFREFIAGAKQKVVMNRSGRCAPEVIDLANAWMDEAGQLPGLAEAFKPEKMLPVPGHNPVLLYAPEAELFDLDRAEEDWMIKHIKRIRKDHAEASIAVLVRSNAQVNRVTGMLHLNKIPAVSLSEQMNVNPVFSIILAYLKLLHSPGDLELQKRWYKLMVEQQIILDNDLRRQWMDTMPLFYQSPIELPDELLKQWAYDYLDDSRHAAGGNISALIARITDRFFISVSDRSNGYLCVLMAQDILASFSSIVHLSPLEIVIHQFESFSQSWRGKKSFSEVLSKHVGDVVQVMSIHKSKGQEFDAVFMPFLQADSFPHEAERIRFDEADKLIQELDRIAARQSGNTLAETYIDDKKREKIEEEARLIYVGLTRARKALYLSAHTKAMTKYNKLRDVQPAIAFQILAGKLAAPSVEVALDHAPGIVPKEADRAENA